MLPYLLCAHVDDLLFASRGVGTARIHKVLDTFIIGKIESGAFRFCGREYLQSEDGGIHVNVRDNTKTVKPITIPQGAKHSTPVTPQQRTALRSVVGSLAWISRAARPDIAYRVNALQTAVSKPTVATLVDANKVLVLELALKDITYKANALEWKNLALVTFSDASWA